MCHIPRVFMKLVSAGRLGLRKVEQYEWLYPRNNQVHPTLVATKEVCIGTSLQGIRHQSCLVLHAFFSLIQAFEHDPANEYYLLDESKYATPNQDSKQATVHKVRWTENPICRWACVQEAVLSSVLHYSKRKTIYIVMIHASHDVPPWRKNVRVALETADITVPCRGVPLWSTWTV